MKQLVFITIALLLASCAQFATITGGEKDTTPPLLDTEKTFPANRTINFKSDKITLTFDEYFTISNPNQTVFVSPTLPNKLDYKTKGKSLIIDLNNTLKPNTTYTINFGDAIKDFNANNVLKNFTYVFSTGTYIDSLSLNGEVNDAFTGNPEADVLVMIYDSVYDSIVTNSSPTYFTKTDKKGTFKLENLKEGEYKIVALKDENRNYKFDLPNEKIAFKDQLIKVDSLSSKNKVSLQLFQEDYLKQSIKSKKIVYPGKLIIELNRPAKNISLSSLDSSTVILKKELSTNKDSLIIWTKSNNEQFKIETTIDSIIDTLTIYPYKKTTDTLLTINQEIQTVEKNAPYVFSFNRPIASIQKDKFLVKKDTLKLKIDSLYLDSNQQLNINLNKKNQSSYSLFILPNGLKDIYNKPNTDTIKVELKTFEKDFFGSLGVNLDSTKTNQNYIIYVKKNNTTIASLTYSGKTAVFNKLTPGTYTIGVLIDENKNGKWDTGNYYQNQKPETYISFKEQLTIRSNWEIKENFSVK